MSKPHNKWDPEVLAQRNRAQREYEATRMRGRPNPFEERNRLMKEMTDRREKVLKFEASGVIHAEEGVVAHEKFSTAYPNIAKDPLLYDIALATDRLYLQAGDTRHPSERFEEIGERLSELSASEQFMDDVQLTPPDDVARAVLDSRDFTRSEVVAGMRDQRGRFKN